MAHHDLSTVDERELPLALAEVHRGVTTGDLVGFRLTALPNLHDIVQGAGFGIDDITDGGDHCELQAVRRWELPDHVGPNLRLLLVGLNPSPAAADSGVAFARPGNRFWPALLSSGLATVDRDPVALVADHGVGTTDLVKRTTRRAVELAPEEFDAGVARLERLAAWLRPGVVGLVGFQGWRTAVDRQAVAGVQPRTLGGRPLYLMPNPSGLNANHRLDDFVDHFRAMATLADADAPEPPVSS